MLVQLFATPRTVARQALSMGILQARILEWVSIPFSRGSSQPRDQTWVFCITGRFFTIWATREDHTPPYLVPKVALCRPPIHPVLRTLTCVCTLAYIHLLIGATLNIPPLFTKILLILQNLAKSSLLPHDLSLLPNKNNFSYPVLIFYLYALYNNSYILSFHNCVYISWRPTNALKVSYLYNYNSTMVIIAPTTPGTQCSTLCKTYTFHHWIW